MCERLRALVAERLAAAAEDVFALFEKSLADFEEENQRKQRLLDLLLSPRVLLPRDQTRDQTRDLPRDQPRDQTRDLPRDQTRDQTRDLPRDLPCRGEGSKPEYEHFGSEQSPTGVQSPSPSPGPGPGPGLNQDLIESMQIKEELEEEAVKQEDEPLPVCVPESSAVCVKTEESSQSELREQLSSEPHHSQTEAHIVLCSDSDDDYCTGGGGLFTYSAAKMEAEADGAFFNQLQIPDGAAAAQSSGLTPQFQFVPETSASVTNGQMSAAEGAERKKHQCPLCHKRFGSKQYLQIHIKLHSGERSYSCTVCQKMFSQKSNLKTHMKIHMKTHTGEREAEPQCSVCKRKFKTHKYLKRHFKVHTIGKPYGCTVCKKTYTKKWALDSHMRGHTGEKPFSCSLCEKSFRHKFVLQVHMNAHTGDKLYSCALCNKVFTRKFYLNRHEKTHTGEKPYGCSLCDKAFTQKSNLNRHMSTHRADPAADYLQSEPYSCSPTDQSLQLFTYRPDPTVAQLEKAHSEKPYGCSFCNKAFTQKSHLNRHMSTHRADPAADYLQSGPYS